MRFGFISTLGCMIIIGLALPLNAQDVEIIDCKIPDGHLNDPALWDLENDNVYEIFTTNYSGTAACYHADTLKLLWENQISKESLTAPVIGNLMASGAPVITFASASGKVFFVWPGSGEVISTVDLKVSLTHSPSIVELDNGTRDGVVFADGTGQIIVLTLNKSGLPETRFKISNKLSDATAFSTIGQISQPPSCGDLNGDGISEIVAVSDSGVLEVISLADTPKRYTTRLAQQSRATTLLAIGNLDTSAEKMILLGVDARLHAYQWDPEQAAAQAISATMEAPAYGLSLGHLLIGPVNSDTIPDLVSTSDGTIGARYLGNDFSGNKTLLDIAPKQLTTTAPPFSPAAVITRKDGSATILAIDQDGTGWAWQPATSDNQITRFPGLPTPSLFTPAGDFTGNGKLSLVIWNEKKSKLSVATFPIEVASKTDKSGPMLTLGVNYSRTGEWGAVWAKDIAKRLQAQADAYKRLSSAKNGETEDSAETTDRVSMIAGIAPSDPVAAQISVKHNTGTHVWRYIVLGGFLLLAAGGALLLKRRNK